MMKDEAAGKIITDVAALRESYTPTGWMGTIIKSVKGLKRM